MPSTSRTILIDRPIGEVFGFFAAFHAIAGPVRPRGDYTFRDVGLSTEVTFALDAPLSGIKSLFMGKAVQKTTDAEVAGLDRAKSLLESRT